MAEFYLPWLSNVQMLKCIYEYSVIFLFTMLTATLMYWYVHKRKYSLPPGPPGFRHLGTEPFKELNRLKKMYGNVFSLYIGWTYTVIVDDFEVLKEAYAKTIDKSVDFDILPDALGFSGHNGGEWVEQRRFGVKSMRDHGVGKEKWESEVQEDVNDLIQQVFAYKGQPVDIIRRLTSSISNNISSFVLGKRLPFDHPDRIFLDDVMDEIILLLGQAPSRSLLPSVQDICIALRIGKVYEKLKKFNNFFRRETEKLRKTYKSGEHKNFIVDYLVEMDNRRCQSGHFFTERNLYGNIQGLFLGASETTRTAIYWLFLIMAEFPEVQAKVQEELDSELGENGEIRWSTRSRVPYTFATIMEGQRWRTLTPLNSPRISAKDIKLQNYDIPRRTPIIVNIWGVHNDPKYWKEPEKFDPERFLSGKGREIIARPDSYIPFSYGKRNCPGESIALMEILLYFTIFMQNFTISAPEGARITLNGIQCITYQAIPQKLCFVPRKNS